MHASPEILFITERLSIPFRPQYAELHDFWPRIPPPPSPRTQHLARGGRPRLIIHEYAVTFSGRGFVRVAEVAETQVLEARWPVKGGCG